jgi:hypothetical protein
MQIAISVKVANVRGGFELGELNDYLAKGYTVDNAYASTDNALLVILDEPKKETDVPN